MNDNVKVAAFLAASVTVVGLSAVTTIRNIQKEQQERLNIRENSHLDIQAIKKAQAVITDRIDRGEIRSIDQLARSLRTEIDFQKIAIREDH